jgi:hypothetical protein
MPISEGPTANPYIYSTNKVMGSSLRLVCGSLVAVMVSLVLDNIKGEPLIVHLTQ